MINTILWDFNGTVMDDMGASAGAVNAMLRKRNLPLISEEWYTLNLIMPLEAFYASVGFDMEKSGSKWSRRNFSRNVRTFRVRSSPKCLRLWSNFKRRAIANCSFRRCTTIC